LQVDEEVRGAVDGGRPVVALESTIVAHGMPYPQNLELALEVESILREHDVVPATIAIRNGICRVGLKPKELEDLARAGEQGRADKCSTRDIPLFLARHRARTTLKQQQQHDPEQQHVLWGATTVAATMKLAHLAGISAFVTGGTGGVHRGGEDSLDISADLTELAQTPVVVVSAGVKSILDIQRTLEVLETNSIPTMGWQTDEFPAFFSPSSGVPCPVRVDSADFVADAYWAARELNMSQGMLVAVPNNDPAGQNVEENIRVALKMAEDMKIQGKDVTPFILKTVAVRTGGDSLRSNMHLVRQNARVGAAIAKAIADARPQE
jgi:pseudouridine-5'-phosphate glycosidase